MAIDLRSIFLSTCLILPLLGSLDILTTTWRMHNLNCRLHSTLHSYRVSVCEYPVWKYRVFIWYGYEFWEYCRYGQEYSTFWVEKLLLPCRYWPRWAPCSLQRNSFICFADNKLFSEHCRHYASSAFCLFYSSAFAIATFPFFSTIVSNCA